MWSRRAGLRSPIVKMFLPLGRRDSRRIIYGPSWQNVATRDRMWSRGCKKAKHMVTNCSKHVIQERVQREGQNYVHEFLKHVGKNVYGVSKYDRNLHFCHTDLSSYGPLWISRQHASCNDVQSSSRLVERRAINMCCAKSQSAAMWSPENVVTRKCGHREPLGVSTEKGSP